MSRDDFDDEDDDLAAFAARDEEPRADLGYETTTAPRHRRRPPGGATHWTFVETPGPARDAGVIGGTLTCAPAPKGCGQPAPTLHADPRTTDCRRVICGRCEGAINADRVGAAIQRDQPARGGRR